MMGKEARHYVNAITDTLVANDCDREAANDAAWTFVNAIKNVDSSGIQIARDDDTYELYIMADVDSENIMLVDVTNNLAQLVEWTTDIAFNTTVMTSIPQFIEFG